MATQRAKPYVWRHAIQALAVYFFIAVVVNLLELLPPLGGFLLNQVAMVVGILAMIALAYLAYHGSSFRLPWISDFADRWQPAGSLLIDAGLSLLKQQTELALHRRNLAHAVPAPPTDMLPTVAAKPGPRGFELEFVSGLGALATSLVGERATPFFTRGEVVVAHWPLRLGDEVRVRYRAWPRKDATVERISASLKCVEKMAYRNDHDTTSSYGMLLQVIAISTTSGQKEADGSVSASWTLKLPREGPASFVANGGSIGWTLEVEVTLAGGRPATQLFDLLVVPQVASQLASA
jgi:uncharacterized membrane protein